MRIIFFILLSLSISACNQSAIGKKLAASDSLVINFNIPGTDSIGKTVAATDKAAIRKLAGFMDGKTTEENKCGYDGNMIFYSKGEQLMPVLFKYKDKSCRFFLYEFGGKTISASMNTEAADLLESLVAGKLFY